MVQNETATQKYMLRYRNTSHEEQKKSLKKKTCVITQTFTLFLKFKVHESSSPKCIDKKKLLSCLNFTFNTLPALAKCLHGFNLTDTSEDYAQILSPNSHYHQSLFSCCTYQQIPFFCFSNWSSQLPAVLWAPIHIPQGTDNVPCSTVRRARSDAKEFPTYSSKAPPLHSQAELCVNCIYPPRKDYTVYSYNPGKYWAFK